MTKLERLLNLVSALLATEKPLSREMIRERIPGAYSDSKESFRRTFERDKDELRRLGVPLSIERISGEDPPIEGYRILHSEYSADAPELDLDEIAALHLASNLVRLNGERQDSAFFKLGGVPGADISPLGNIQVDDRVNQIMNAIVKRVQISFTYNGKDRLLEAHRLLFKNGKWYLIAFDILRGENRNFRVDRIEGHIEITSKTFTPSEAIEKIGDEPSWRFGENQHEPIDFLVNESHALWATQYLTEDSIKEKFPNGSVLFSEEVRNWEKFRSFLITFLDAVEIVHPQESRQKFSEWLRAMS